uniref:Glycosyltransferase n=1 Tax=Rubia yunnanensis TaxID=1650721 RepID=A0A896ARS6_9GENT|nr:anthraquinone glycosyltransferase [Rubia yunnanensis]
MKKAELVVIPIPGVGHLTSTLEVSKLLTSRSDRLSVTVLVMKPPTDQKAVPESSDPRIRLIECRREEPPQDGNSTAVSPRLALFEFIDSHRAHMREILQEIRTSETADLAGIVIDMFCTSTIDLADEFGVPSYLYYTSGAAMLGLVFHLQSLRDDFGVDVTEFKDSNEELAVSTYMNPFPARVLPSGVFNKEGCDVFLNQGRRYRETKGLIINTFQELEFHAIQALLNDGKIPPVYPIGPILKLGNISDHNPESDMILKWLDLQPDSSVVFLCFGSMGTFSEEQVQQIAYALEKAGCRFLWSLRKAKTDFLELPEDYENLEEVLPEGFLQRTADVGRVIGWAPQVAILSHTAVGGFVSHCGWNSTLESIWCGVPLATWPLYAEQQTNSFLLVKDLGLAVEIKMDYRREFEIEPTEIVSADVIADGIKKLMDPGNGIREKMKEVKEKSKLALGEGGSSSAYLKSFLDNVIDSIP